MIHSKADLKTEYTFGDFLFYTCLLAVPIVTALVGIFRYSTAWGVVFLVVSVTGVGAILRFYCTRCPHYTRSGRTLNCIFFRGFPKFFAPRPGPLNTKDMLIAFGATAAILLFPVYWLLREPGLFIIYLLSLAAFGTAVYRNECERCIYFECPANRVPEDFKRAEG